MAKQFKLCYVFMDTSDWTAPEREFMNLDEAKMNEWGSTHPMPKNSLFANYHEAIYDISSSSGIITVSFEESSEFIEWYGDLLVLD